MRLGQIFNIAVFNQFIDSFTRKALLLSNSRDIDEALKNIYLLSHVIYPYSDSFLVKTHRYMEKYREYRRYYDRIKALLLNTSQALEKRLREEIGFLKAQGIESIISRIIYLMAVLNCDEPLYRRYLDPLKIRKILSVPSTPWAQHSKIFDFITEDTHLNIIPGGVIQLWALKILLEELNSRGVSSRIYLPATRLLDYISSVDYFEGINNEAEVVPYNPEKLREIIAHLGEKHELVLVSNILGIASITTLLHIEDKTYDNIYLLFNPMETRLAQYLVQTPYIMPATNLIETIRIKAEK